MERLLFREEQSFRQSFVLWIILSAWLLMFFSIGYSFYLQLYLGKPVGDQPSADSTLLWTGIGAMFFVSAIFTVLLNARLVTEIWSDGIRFKFTPFVRKMRFISLSEIASAEVTRYRPVADYGGWGWRQRRLGRRKGEAYNVSGRTGVKITLTGGKIIMLGTQKPDDMKYAVTKMKIAQQEKMYR